MWARKFLFSGLAFLVGVITVGFVSADDPQPVRNTVQIPPVAPAPVSQTPASPAPTPLAITPPEAKEYSASDVEKTAQQTAKALKPGQKLVMTAVTCVQAEADVIQEIGLMAERPKNQESSSLLATCLNHRESKMLEALIKTKSSGFAIISRPHLNVADGQTGYVQVGRQVPLSLGLRNSPFDGKVEHKAVYAMEGINLKVTPTISKDNKFVLLQLAPQNSRVVNMNKASDNLALPVPPEVLKKELEDEVQSNQPGVENIPFSTVESVQIMTSVVIPTGGTVVIGKKIDSNKVIETRNYLGTRVERKTEAGNTMLLWIITAHVVVGK